MFKLLDTEAILARVKNLADDKNNDFHTDDQYRAFIQEAFDELYSELTYDKESYFVRDPIVHKSDEVARIYYPQDMYKLILVEALFGDRGIKIDSISKSEGSKVSSNIHSFFYGDYVNIPYGYSLFSDHIKFYPEAPNRNKEFRITYSLEIPDIGGAKLQKGWEHYLTYKAAYLSLVAQDNVRPGLEKRAMEWKNNIRRYSKSRDESTAVLQGAGESRDYWW